MDMLAPSVRWAVDGLDVGFRYFLRCHLLYSIGVGGEGGDLVGFLGSQVGAKDRVAVDDFVEVGGDLADRRPQRSAGFDESRATAKGRTPAARPWTTVVD